MNKLPSWINQALNKMRELNIKQMDLMDVFGVSTRGAIGHYFAGRTAITAEQLNNLSKRLDCDLSIQNTDGISEVDARESITEGVFRAIQANLIQLNDNIKIKTVTDSIIDELRENNLISSPNNTK